MNRILLVAQYEFFSNIKKKSFLLAAIGGPLFTIGIMVVATLLSLSSIEAGQAKGERVGYVDEAQVLGESPIGLPDTYQAFANEERGRKALDDKEIDLLAVIAPNYIKTGKVSLYAYGSVSESLEDQLEGVLSTNLAHSLTDQVPEERVKNPVNTEYFLENNGRALNSDAAVAAVIITPVMFVIIFMIALQLTGTYLMTSIVEEKTNRIMEILATSVTPTQLLAGKLLGVGGLGLVQILIWLAVAAVGLIVGRNTEIVQAVQVPFDVVIFALAYFVLNYFMFGSILAGVGVVVGSEQESRQVAGIVTVVTVIPLILMSAFLMDPDAPVPVFLSLFPFTAPMAMLLRLMLGAVSPLELIISFGLMFLTTMVVVWMSARVFRWAMLLYGKRLTPRELWRVIRGHADTIVVSPVQQEGR
jgi:ABC-2 type transport system permease protein